jgi:D-alanyl-D-alanine carboxypeptidase (penicillin-binding protein 5/6)
MVVALVVAAGSGTPAVVAARAGGATPVAGAAVDSDAPTVTLLPRFHTPPSVTAVAAILMDWRTGQVLYAKDAYRRRDPASTTKILTAVVLLENARLSEVTTVSRNAAWTPGSFMPLRAGQELTLGELLWGMLLRSGNNACVAVSEHVAGSERAFVEMMNRRAAELGARNTRFRNSHGISVPGHYTTAFDLALMARHALTIPAFEAIVRTREATLYVDGGEAEVELRNTNTLLWTFAGADGVKTGTTDRAGRCLVASATRDGRRLLSVVLHSDERYRDTATLLAWGFEHYDTVRLAPAGSVMATAKVSGGIAGEVVLTTEADFWVSCPLWMTDALNIEVHVREPLRAPLRRGEVVGVVEAAVADQVVRAVNLVAAEDIPLWTPERFLLKQIMRLLRFLSAHAIG